MTGILGVQAGSRTELPETSLSRLQAIPTGGTPQEFAAREKTIGDIATLGKNLQAALAAGRQKTVMPGPEGYAPAEQLVADEGQFPGGAFRVGETGRVALPAADMGEVPKDWFAMMRGIAQGGEAPTAANAERISQMYNLPIAEVPGGPEAMLKKRQDVAQAAMAERTVATPYTFDQLVAISQDPSKTPQERATAIAQAKAIQAARIEEAVAKRPEKVEPTVGETGHPWVNKNGDYADESWGARTEAPQKGYFRMSPKEENILQQTPRALTMVGNLMETARQMNKLGGCRESGGPMGLYERARIAGTKEFGDPAGLGGLLSLWEGQRSQLISIFRALDEKGNLPRGITMPQLEAMSPAKGFTATANMLGLLKGELLQATRSSRFPGLEAKFPEVPDVILTSDPKYLAAQAMKKTDEYMERPVSQGGLGLLIVPSR